MTTVADGLFQYGGVPVGVNPPFGKIFNNPYAAYKKGRAWFVDASYGGNGDGKSPKTAFSTMDQAFDNLHSGDIIYATGNIREQLVTPVQVFDVTVIGCGNQPRNADSSPDGGQYAACTWRAPASPVAAQATVRVLQQGWTFYNILFGMGDVNSAGVEVVRNADAGDSERDGSHVQLIGCRFGGTGIGVRITAAGFTENPFNGLIQGCKFNSCTYGILASSAQPNSWDIDNNIFQGCTNAIIAKFQATVIRRNVVMGFTAAANSGGIDIRSGGANNLVTGNALGGTYSKAGGYNCEANDEWYGNAASTGFTSADPA